jgi:uncharacterized protein YjbI with pentapeptide repeats
MIDRVAPKYPVRRWAARALAVTAATGVLSATAMAQAPARQITFWDLALGSHARELPIESLADFACGTNGGLPATAIKDWTEFARCPAEKATGLHEVQFRYDDATEYRMRAAVYGQDVPPIYGTVFYNQPVIVSGLFDDDGFLIALRAVSDPRVPEQDRMQAISLRSFLINRFDADGWSCVDTPLAEREQPIGNLTFKQDCTKIVGGSRVRLESNFYRKAGQNAIDPATGLVLQGQFRSDVRFERFLVEPVTDRASRLAIIAAQPREVTAIERARLKALDCPGCDLSGVFLRRQDLRGARLAGANLRNADLHAANLAGADLTGADLTGAVMNRADLRRARLAGAKLESGEFFAAQLDGADLSGADLKKALMGSAQMTRVNLQGASLIQADLNKARLLDGNLKGATISNTWFSAAQLNRADLSGATIESVDFTDATLVGANLSNANIVQTDFYGTNLRDSDLTGARIAASRMTSANLTGVKRDRTNFENVIDAP